MIITYLLEQLKSNIGIHFGDLGKGSDTFLGRMYAGGGGRGTGHFGTGVYFLSPNVKNKTVLSERPYHEIDCSNYNLMTIKNAQDGFNVHRGLTFINKSVIDALDGNEDAMWNNIDKGLSIIAVVDKKANAISPNKIAMLAKQKAEIFEKENIESKEDTLSTEVIRLMGYEGIDVRGIEELDNSTYGSVIYNLK